MIQIKSKSLCQPGLKIAQQPCKLAWCQILYRAHCRIVKTGRHSAVHVHKPSDRSGGTSMPTPKTTQLQKNTSPHLHHFNDIQAILATPNMKPDSRAVLMYATSHARSHPQLRDFALCSPGDALRQLLHGRHDGRHPGKARHDACTHIQAFMYAYERSSILLIKSSSMDK